ncbi:hypothetical protein B0T16DRAFT_435099 [Cercophora newfieldiana]|uniref:NAD(P)-binding protein n=1 Tax=Cercophora newfieldiana TaxID=92897 RepID=A0AA39YIR0_9PEZI|nr:hypothetical protein B0T16DRAFT_435099 [Cercophora newfieldiana]
MPSFPPNYFLNVVRHQFRSIPEPSTSYKDQIVIVTGANHGIGFEAARSFAQLGASKVILACRSSTKGEAAKKLIDSGLSLGPDIVEVWPLDLCSFESVKEFCRRASTLSRLDVVLANAAVLEYQLLQAPDAGGFERTIATNVISTLLMALLLLPKLRATAARHNTTSRLTFVVSDAHCMAQFEERNEPKIFDYYKSTKGTEDRYATSKLLEVFLVRELATRAKLSHPGTVFMNMANPGFCKPTTLFKTFPPWLQVSIDIFAFFFARSAQVGARTLLHAVDGGSESYGEYLESGEVSVLSPYVVSNEGVEMQQKLWGELMEILEGIEPGVTKNI